ncbi:MarR family winged helix-turn-helix transcriptional regulator [Curtobacterium sp. RRHDQ10]|uniref:MarR family winged helix-turn-helix transcriptional regulator n=1 Tax=Curtobacterium phyllosphaerae TaxID=3413379 RepID=UPI003BF364FD
MTSEAVTAVPGYWSDQGARVTGTDVLDALRAFRAAEAEARLRARTSLGVGESALMALRLIGDGERTGHRVAPKELAEHLGITAASTSTLVDRLVRAGHVVRHPDPHDRRGVTLTTRGIAVRRALRAMRDLETRTLRAAAAMPPESLEVVVAFLQTMTRVVEDAGDAVAPQA